MATVLETNENKNQNKIQTHYHKGTNLPSKRKIKPIWECLLDLLSMDWNFNPNPMLLRDGFGGSIWYANKSIS